MSDTSCWSVWQRRGLDRRRIGTVCGWKSNLWSFSRAAALDESSEEEEEEEVPIAAAVSEDTAVAAARSAVNCCCRLGCCCWFCRPCMGAAPSPMRSTLFDLRLLMSFVSHTSSHRRHTYSLHVIQHLAFHRVLYGSNNDNSSSCNSASSSSSSSSYALNNVMHTRTQQ